jgi:hypothetical protein
MMSAVLSRIEWPKWRLTRSDLMRGLLTGSLWGVTLTAGLTAMAVWQCGGVCLPQLAVTAGLSLFSGIFGLGPLAAYGRR